MEVEGDAVDDGDIAGDGSVVGVGDRQLKERPPEFLWAAEVARIVWEANRAIQVRDGEEVPDVPWDAAEWHRKKAVIFGVMKMRDGSIRGAQEAHVFWWEYMSSKGWEWGEVKDPGMRRHPLLKEWGELTSREQLAQRASWEIVQLVMASEVEG
jgi:hypothetical protein